MVSGAELAVGKNPAAGTTRLQHAWEDPVPINMIKPQPTAPRGGENTPKNEENNNLYRCPRRIRRLRDAVKDGAALAAREVTATASLHPLPGRGLCGPWHRDDLGPPSPRSLQTSAVSDKATLAAFRFKQRMPRSRAHRAPSLEALCRFSSG